MSKWLSMLEKAGLVTSTGADADVAEEALDLATEPSDAPVVPSLATEIEENIPLDEIYKQAGVPSAQFPVERLVKVLDGLAGMDPATQRAAISAMDAADETWSMDDVLLDAQAKSDTLGAYDRMVQEDLASVETRALQEVDALNQHREQSVAEIRQQIQGLEQRLEEEVSATAKNIAESRAKLENARAAAERERWRVQTQREALRKVLSQFGKPDTPQQIKPV